MCRCTSGSRWPSSPRMRDGRGQRRPPRNRADPRAGRARAEGAADLGPRLRRGDPASPAPPGGQARRPRRTRSPRRGRARSRPVGRVVLPGLRGADGRPRAGGVDRPPRGDRRLRRATRPVRVIRTAADPPLDPERADGPGATDPPAETGCRAPARPRPGRSGAARDRCARDLRVPRSGDRAVRPGRLRGALGAAGTTVARRAGVRRRPVAAEHRGRPTRTRPTRRGRRRRGGDAAGERPDAVAQPAAARRAGAVGARQRGRRQRDRDRARVEPVPAPHADDRPRGTGYPASPDRSRGRAG